MGKDKKTTKKNPQQTTLTPDDGQRDCKSNMSVDSDQMADVWLEIFQSRPKQNDRNIMELKLVSMFQVHITHFTAVWNTWKQKSKNVSNRYIGVRGKFLLFALYTLFVGTFLFLSFLFISKSKLVSQAKLPLFLSHYAVDPKKRNRRKNSKCQSFDSLWKKGRIWRSFYWNQGAAFRPYFSILWMLIVITSVTPVADTHTQKCKWYISFEVFASVVTKVPLSTRQQGCVFLVACVN